MSIRTGGDGEGFVVTVEVDDVKEEVVSISAENTGTKTYTFTMLKSNGQAKFTVGMPPGFSGTQSIAPGQRDKMFAGFHYETGLPILAFPYTLVGS